MSNLQNFFDEFKKELVSVNDNIKDKLRRSQSDYNIFTTLLNYNDEVNLHSAFLYSLLNPKSKHYQKELFLKKFFEVLELSRIGFAYQSAYVEKERYHIDLLIGDGEKYIIIENKINASDQEAQIQRYIDTIKIENNIEDNGSIYVVFLTKNKDRKISNRSIGDYKFDGDKFLAKDDFKVNYKHISYDNEILKWLDECKKEVEDTDLMVFIKHYKGVVRMLNEQKEKPTCLETIKNNYVLASEISRNLVEPRRVIVHNFMKQTHDILLKHEISNWEIKEYNELKYKNFNRPIIICEKNLKEQENLFYFVVEIEQKDFLRTYFGFVRSGEKIRNCKEIVEFQNLKVGNPDCWFGAWEWVSDKNKDHDLAIDIQSRAITPENFAIRIIDFVNKYKSIVERINKNIEQYLVE